MLFNGMETELFKPVFSGFLARLLHNYFTVGLLSFLWNRGSTEYLMLRRETQNSAKLNAQ